MIVEGVEVRDIPGFTEYAISRDGRVWSKDRIDPRGRKWRGRWLKNVLTRAGYFQVRLSHNAVHSFPHVHHLVLETYVGPRPKGKQACHKNDKKIENSLENLYWGTPKENYEDSVRNGKQKFSGPRGQNNHFCRLTEKKVRKIVKLFETGKYSKAELGRMFGVTGMAILAIIRKKNWGWIWTK